MNENWKNDPRLKSMNPEKIRLLEHFADRLSHTEKSQLMEAFLDINREARQRGIAFTDRDTEVLTSILAAQMSPEERKKLNFFKMVSKKIAGKR